MFASIFSTSLFACTSNTSFLTGNNHNRSLKIQSPLHGSILKRSDIFICLFFDPYNLKSKYRYVYNMLKGGLHLKGVKSGLGNGTQCISLTSTPPSFSGGPVWVLHTCSHTHCLVFFIRSILYYYVSYMIS